MVNLKQFALISAIIVTSSLAPINAILATEGTNLENKKWIVEQIAGQKGKHLGFIKFNNGQLEGQSTCNLYSALYDVKPNQQMTIHRIGAGILECNFGNKMQLETQFLEGLETTKSYKIDNGQLILYTKDNKEIARFK